MLETFKNFDITADIFGILLAIIALLIIFVSRTMEKKTASYFRTVFSTLSMALLSNMLGLVFRGQDTGAVYTVLWISNFCEFFFGYLLAYSISRYLLYVISAGNKNELTGWRRFFFGMFAFSVLLLIVSQFTGLFYTIDPHGFYRRGPLFWLSQAFGILTLIVNVFLIIRYRKRLTPKERSAFLVYVSLPALAVVLQMFLYGIYLMLMVSTMSAVVMLVIIISDQTDKFCAKKKELADMQAAIMLSQIQPHFLYNSLTSIAQLCEKNPGEAKRATIAFAEYLRNNMDSLQKRPPIPFINEMKHIKTYLLLEQMRFGEELKCVFNIHTTDFKIPALSVQPIVENAVKWGVGQKESGGTVTLSTFDYDDRIEIVVEDDGVGFDKDNKPKDAKYHVGMENVRERMKMILNAEMKVESKVGVGTKVTISIPKGDGKNEDISC